MAVHLDVAVAHQLACLRARVGKAEAVYDVVEAHFEHLEQVLACYTRSTLGGLKMAAELLFEHAIQAAGLLLLPKLQPEVRHFACAALAVRSWRLGSALKGALRE